MLELVLTLLVSIKAPSYDVFPEDWQRYETDFLPLLPTTTRDAVADDYEVFLPVSYHMNPKNFDAFESATRCTAKDLDWYGKMPSYHYCGFYGRECYDDDYWCKSHCASDLLQAFGNHSVLAKRGNFAREHCAVQGTDDWLTLVPFRDSFPNLAAEHIVVYK